MCDTLLYFNKWENCTRLHVWLSVCVSVCVYWPPGWLVTLLRVSKRNTVTRQETTAIMSYSFKIQYSLHITHTSGNTQLLQLPRIMGLWIMARVRGSSLRFLRWPWSLTCDLVLPWQPHMWPLRNNPSRSLAQIRDKGANCELVHWKDWSISDLSENMCPSHSPGSGWLGFADSFIDLRLAVMSKWYQRVLGTSATLHMCTRRI